MILQGYRERASLAGLAFIVSLLAAVPCGAQPRERPPFRTSVDLLTVDAVVVGRDGRHVTDLTAADFEIRQSGRVLALRQAVYVDVQAKARSRAPAAPPVRATDLATLGAPTSAPREESAARTIAIVIDDLQLSFESSVAVRTALHRFIDEQVQAGDLVAIVRTAGGAGVLQQFTADRRVLRAAADRSLWAPVSRGSIVMGGGGEDISLRGSLLVSGALGTLESTVRGLQRLPGRKAIVFFSDGIDLFSFNADARVTSAVRRLIEAANRGGVVLYPIDTRGLVYVSPGEASRLLQQSQDGLRFLAAQTGGFAEIGNNDLNLGLDRMLEDQRGYYLLGYDPPEDGAREKEAPRVSVRVRRPGMRVRARNGFFGPVAPEHEPPEVDALELAARSPFAASAITVRLTALFGYDGAEGPYVHALLLIDPNDLRFSERTGAHHAQLDVLLLAFAENGTVAARWQQAVAVVVSDDELKQARQQGLLRSVRFPAKAPGSFQIRAAVRDKATGALGSASQFMMVPRVGRGRIALSGVLMRDAPDEAALSEAGVAAVAPVPAAGALGGPAIRVFRSGGRAVYACEIYNGLPPRDTVVSIVTLFRNGRVVYEAPATKVEPGPAGERPGTIPLTGVLTFSRELPAGAYVLQISVGRVRRGKTQALATQWSDFEVQ